ncbi:hypothetical protein N1F89_03975 [Aquibium sp. A9E412]|uniref:hypothetical protein n=1 Tax=Aquibium sp. A9E412 TaxID=2976767 RepID=UPI0025AFBAE0|nr:hypothetical protein [Aquibium sp. A9E412]MDN2565369.1 hypothetical protein [Aquibium sp. A9E412]
MLDGDDVLDQRRFRHAVNERAEVRLPESRKAQFEAQMDALFAEEEYVDPPPGATLLDHFAELLQTFLTDRYRAQERDEIL